MKIKNRSIFALMLVVLAVSIFGCAKSSDQSKSSQATKIRLSNKPLTDFKKIVGNNYMYNRSYVGKPVKSLEKITTWETHESNLSFAFIKKNEAFVGRYSHSKLVNGRIYTVTKSASDFYSFKLSAVVTNQTTYNRLSAKNKQRYQLLDSKKLPGSTTGMKYYQAKSTSKATAPRYRFYILKNKLVREIPGKNGKRFYAEYVKK